MLIWENAIREKHAYFDFDDNNRTKKSTYITF